MSFNSRKHDFDGCMLPEPSTLFYAFYVLPLLAVPCMIYMGWDKGLRRSLMVAIFTIVFLIFTQTHTGSEYMVHLIYS